MPQSILEEGMRADHHKSVAASQRAEEVHANVSLRQVLPAAAAIAVATATAAQADLPKKAEGPAIHKDLSSELVKPNTPSGHSTGDGDRVV